MGVQALTIYGNVGAVTGRIRHDGDVRIFGSILPGYEVVSGGSLFVSRDVRRARALAGGDLAVNGIVTGSDAVLDAVGSVSVRHVADAEVVAGLDIEVRTAAVRARLAAGRRILLTGPPGIIQGGTARAGLGVEAARVLSSGGREARVVVGRSTFREDVEQLEERLHFARRREAVARLGEPGSPEGYRRQVADLAAYRTLAGALERRLRRLETAGGLTGRAFLRVSGPGPVRAEVAIGPGEEGLGPAGRWQDGEFVAVLAEGGVQVRSLKESTRVG